MRTEYYRLVKGFEGRPYRVRVPEQELRGLVTTIVTVSAGVSLVLMMAAFLLGLSVR